MSTKCTPGVKGWICCLTMFSSYIHLTSFALWIFSECNHIRKKLWICHFNWLKIIQIINWKLHFLCSSAQNCWHQESSWRLGTDVWIIWKWIDYSNFALNKKFLAYSRLILELSGNPNTQVGDPKNQLRVNIKMIKRSTGTFFTFSSLWTWTCLSFFLIGIHSMKGQTATTRHGVTKQKKKNMKRIEKAI